MGEGPGEVKVLWDGGLSKRDMERSKCFRPLAPQMVGHERGPSGEESAGGRWMSMCAPF